MKHSSLSFILLLALAACEDEPIDVSMPDGTYTGTFYRSSPGGKYDVSGVTLILDRERFQGVSSITKYPAICHGTYTISADHITFVNLCLWTAEFDWRYILSGTFRISRERDEIIMTRSYGDLAYDTYRLELKATTTN